MQTTHEPDYVRLLAGQLVDTAASTRDLAADLADFDVPEDTPANVVRAAAWGRHLNAYSASAANAGSSTTMMRSWPRLLAAGSRHGGKSSIDHILEPRD
ncbi:hypothetical protein [Streptomyces pseudogriseolus]|uniref:hypothetical protein n=1 Tax=Streptomyces pseudogriseolus TaxID=36817 RepID=UPI003FA26FD3